MKCKKISKSFCVQKNKFALIGNIKTDIILLQDSFEKVEDAVNIAKNILFGHMDLPKEVSGKLDDFTMIYVVADCGCIKASVRPTWSSAFSVSSIKEKLDKFSMDAAIATRVKELRGEDA